jgi:hypothetical protein
MTRMQPAPARFIAGRTVHFYPSDHPRVLPDIT